MLSYCFVRQQRLIWKMPFSLNRVESCTAFLATSPDTVKFHEVPSTLLTPNSPHILDLAGGNNPAFHLEAAWSNKNVSVISMISPLFNC